MDSITLMVGVVLLSWLLCRTGSKFKLNFKYIFFIGICFCILSSLIYIYKIFSISFIVLIAILSLAVLAGFLLTSNVIFPEVMKGMKERAKVKCEVVTISALVVSAVLEIGWGAILSYKVVYPVMASVGYTGAFYTAFGIFGIFIQAVMESTLISLIFLYTINFKCN